MASPMQATALPRFLLPQITWSNAALRYGAPASILAARRQQSSLSTPRPAIERLRPRTAFQQLSTRSLQNNADCAAAFDRRRNFSTTARQGRDHHFDTLKFVQRLKGEGFTEEQAEAMMRVLSDVIEERYASSMFDPQVAVNLP
jgi:hypothetical protein